MTGPNSTAGWVTCSLTVTPTQGRGLTHSLQPPFSPDQPPARLLSGGRSPRSPSPVSRWGHRGQRQGLKGTISSRAPERPVLPPGAGGRGGLLPGVFFSLSSLPSVLSSSVSYCLSASFRLGRFSHCACLSACLSVCLTRCLAGVQVPAQGWVGVEGVSLGLVTPGPWSSLSSQPAFFEARTG